MKDLIKTTARMVGVDIRRAEPESDAYRQQQLLLRGRKEPVIFDVGASIGTMTKQYRSLFPDARIYAFEPFPDSFQQLKQNVGHNGSTFPIQLALGKQAEKSLMYVNASSATNSLLPTDEGASSVWGEGLLETETQVQIESTTLDAFCSEHDIAHIDILKLDTQGTEPLILEGADQMLRAGRISIIYTEIILVPTYKGQKKFYATLQFLDQRGYSVYGIYNLLHGKNGRLNQIDVIFTGPGDQAKVADA